MQITWFGHSCFRIDTGKSRLLIDPFLAGNPTFEDSGHTVRDVAKGVTHVALTHGHEDHTGHTADICKETAAPLIAVFELAMHMDEVRGAGGLVQSVDVLGDGQHIAMLALEPGKSEMGCIRPCLLMPGAAEIVESMHENGIAGEAFRRRHVLDPVVLP